MKSDNKVIVDKLNKIIELLASVKDDLYKEDAESQELPIYMPDTVGRVVSAEEYNVAEYVNVEDWDFSDADLNGINVAASKFRNILDYPAIPDSTPVVAGAYITAWRKAICKDDNRKYRHVHIGDSVMDRTKAIDAVNDLGGIPAVSRFMKRIALNISDTEELTPDENDKLAQNEGLIGDHDFVLTESQVLTVLGTDYTALNVPSVAALFRAFPKLETSEWENSEARYSAAAVFATMYKISQLVWNTASNDRHAIYALGLAIFAASLELEKDLQHAVESLYKSCNISKEEDELLSFPQLSEACAMTREDICKQLNTGNVGIYKIPCTTAVSPYFAVLRSAMENSKIK